MSKERNKKIQRLLAAAGYYSGEIDGVIGVKTKAGIGILLQRRAGDCISDPLKWSDARRAVGAAQLVLKYAGHTVGSIDGYWGNLTEGAFLEWDHFQKHKVPLELDRRQITTLPPRADIFPRQKDMGDFYGRPGAAVQAQLIMIDLPFPMRLDWSLSTVTKRAQLHRKCADSALRALNLIKEHYGYEKLRELGLDRTAGTYNHRKMRGGNSWSVHAYGAAWDFYAGPNGLNTRAPEALFSRPEYKAWLDIWESVGWVSLGRAIGRDYMHVQAARL